MKLALALIALALAASGCTTRRIEPAPSPAVLEARARAQAAKASPADRCGLYTFVTAAPVRVTFTYNTTTLADAAREQVDRAATWLTCNTDVFVTITAQHDNQGDAAARDALVAARVAAVKARLVAGGVQPARVLSYQPAAGAKVLAFQARGRGW